MSEALLQHILAKKTTTFQWETDDEGVAIEFTKEDGESLKQDFDKFLKEGLPNALRKAIDASSASLARELYKRWPEVQIEENNDMRRFRDRLELRWSATLNPLRMMLTASREAGEHFADKLSRSKAKTGLITRNAIMILHVRACQTATEILTLAENGLADGAYARWRTLYEISVVAFFIDRFGDDVAQRYFDHEAVSSRESLMNEYRHSGKVYEPAKLKGYPKEVEDEFQKFIEKYGKPFAGSYGWAAHNLKNKSPRFQDLEEAVDWKALPPDYKWSSYKIHAGAMGITSSVGTLGIQPMVHSGVTNAGLEIPAEKTAYSLLHVTSLMFGKHTDIEQQVQLGTLIMFRDRVVAEGRKAAKKLKNDELAYLEAISINE